MSSSNRGEKPFFHLCARGALHQKSGPDAVERVAAAADVEDNRVAVGLGGADALVRLSTSFILSLLLLASRKRPSHRRLKPGSATILSERNARCSPSPFPNHTCSSLPGLGGRARAIRRVSSPPPAHEG